MAEMTLLLTIVDLLRMDRSERLAGDGVPDLTDDYACFGAISSRTTPPDNERDAEEDDGVERLAERRRTAGSKSRIVRRMVCQGDGDDGMCQGDGDDGMVFCKSQVRLSFSAP